MRKNARRVAWGVLAAASFIGAVGCNRNKDTDVIILTVGVAEADKAFTTRVVEDF